MRSRTPKVLHPICGRPMLSYVIDAARQATGERPLIVYSPPTAQICDVFADEADFALQDEPRGTGDAVRAAIDVLGAEVEEIVVLSGDVPMIEPDMVNQVLEQRRATGRPMALTAMTMPEPAGYGRLIVEDGFARRIVEQKDASDDELEIQLVNAGLYAFDMAWLRDALPSLTPSAASGELYITQLVEIADSAGTASAVVVDDDEEAEWILGGVNDRADLQAAASYLQFAIHARLMRAGVSIQDPPTTWIDATVEIAEDVTIEGNVFLHGRTKIARDTVVRSGSQVIDSVIGERCVVWSSVVEASTVGNDVRIGPFAHIRAGGQVGDGAEIGNYAEQKNTRFGARSKQHHFSYLGDAQVGEDVNIGAGTITANYDGRRKHPTVIGDRAFIGSDTILRAPIKVGDDAMTGAGSVVTRDVPAGKLAVGVPARIRSRGAQPTQPAPPEPTASADEA